MESWSDRGFGAAVIFFSNVGDTFYFYLRSRHHFCNINRRYNVFCNLVKVSIKVRCQPAKGWRIYSGDPPLMIMVMPLSVQLLSSVDGNDDRVMKIKMIMVMRVLDNIMFYKYSCRYPVGLDDNDYNDNYVVMKKVMMVMIIMMAMTISRVTILRIMIFDITSVNVQWQCPYTLLTVCVDDHGIIMTVMTIWTAFMMTILMMMIFYIDTLLMIIFKIAPDGVRQLFSRFVAATDRPTPMSATSGTTLTTTIIMMIMMAMTMTMMNLNTNTNTNIGDLFSQQRRLLFIRPLSEAHGCL